MLLEAVSQHRAIDLVEKPIVYLDDSIGANAEDVLIVGSMMNLAQWHAVWDHCVLERSREYLAANIV
jgi:hypothetical protein